MSCYITTQINRFISDIDNDIKIDRNLFPWFYAWAFDNVYAIMKDIPRMRAVIEYVSNFLANIYALLTPIFVHTIS